MSGKVTLVPLMPEDRDQFVRDNQWAFKHGAMIEFGERDDHVGPDGEIISRETIEEALDAPNSEAYRIMLDGRKVGGIVLLIDPETNHNHLDLLFIDPAEHGKGIGQRAWRAAEVLHPETEVWETCTPYFEKRNIHFYVNKCGFHIVEFFNEFNPDRNTPSNETEAAEPDEMFRFEKRMPAK